MATPLGPKYVLYRCLDPLGNHHQTSETIIVHRKVSVRVSVIVTVIIRVRVSVRFMVDSKYLDKPSRMHTKP